VIQLDSAWGTPEEGRPRPADLRRERLRSLVRRSALFVPVNVPRFVEKAHARGADAIILDLEDSIPAAEKPAARRLVRDATRECARGGADVEVRINKPFALAMEDLDAAVWPGLDTILFPKAESAREIATLDALIAERERARGMPAGGVQLSIAVETALGLYNAVAIALASPRTVAIALGSEDFTLDIEVEPSKTGQEYLYGKAQMIVVARLAGVQPHGIVGSIADYGDLDAMATAIRQARAMGYMGASCIHPAQVAPLNVYFSPAAEEVAHARKVVAAFEAAVAEGRASVGVEGKMVDIPVAERARRLIARADAIEAKEARKRAALDSLSFPPGGRGVS
jgi:citrate lyase subunit beta/citryl-CoA lyase